MLEYAFSTLPWSAWQGGPAVSTIIAGVPAGQVSPPDLTVVLKKGEEGKYRRFVVLQEQPLRPPLKQGYCRAYRLLL